MLSTDSWVGENVVKNPQFLPPHAHQTSDNKGRGKSMPFFLTSDLINSEFKVLIVYRTFDTTETSLLPKDSVSFKWSCKVFIIGQSSLMTLMWAARRVMHLTDYCGLFVEFNNLDNQFHFVLPNTATCTITAMTDDDMFLFSYRLFTQLTIWIMVKRYHILQITPNKTAIRLPFNQS